MDQTAQFTGLGVDGRALRAGDEERRIGAVELVPHMHHQVAPLARRRQQPGSIVGRRVGAIEGPLAAREVVVLDVDDDQRLLAHAASFGSSRWMTLVIGCVH
ncbi:hypothetical protein D9M73_216780 [compost metagenome]